MTSKINVLYSEQMLSENHEISPSAIKPQYMAELLKDKVTFVAPKPLTVEDFKRCHDPAYVDDVLALRRDNGFGTRSQKVCDSLPYTNGAQYDAAKLAYENKRPTAALVAGFHHAGYYGFEDLGMFCTFNGLMIAATKLIEDGLKRVAIVDCDMHWGNGTDDIIKKIDPSNQKYLNISYGKWFHNPRQATSYLNYFAFTATQLEEFKPDVIIYQSGADVHINDPYGGVLSEEQMYERDLKMFGIAKRLNIPITWNLAGGYQKDANGGCSYVLHLHMNTFKAYEAIYETNKTE